MQRFLTILAGLCACTLYLQAQPEVDERIAAELRLRGVGRKEINILYRNNEAFLPVVPVLDFLGIKENFDSTTSRVNGFFKSPDNPFAIEPSNSNASVGKRRITLSDSDFAIFAGDLYLRQAIINDMFGLDVRYNPHALAVDVGKFRDAPAYLATIRHRRLQQIQKKRNIIPPADLLLTRQPVVLGSERLDWTLSSRFTSTTYLETRYTGSLGAQILGGDGTGRITGYSEPTIGRTHNDLQGQIRWPFLSTPGIQQITVGDYTVLGIMPHLVTGMEITNRPLAQRFLFSREIFRGQFEPHNDIELRGGTTGFQLQESSDEGLYQFDVPVVYGQGNVEVHAYDPWGQEHTVRYRMNVPRTLLPPGEFDYSISAGRVRPPSNVLTSSDAVSYGVSSQLTLGGRMEYYDLATSEKFFGAITGTSIIGHGLAFNAVVAPSAISQMGLDWIFPNYAEVSLTGAKYGNASFFNPTQINDNYNLSLSLPFATNGYQIAVGGFGGQTDYTGIHDQQFQFTLSGVFSGFSPSYSTQLAWRRYDVTGTTTTLTHISLGSLAVYLPAGVVALGELTYDHLRSKAQDMRVEVFKHLPNSFQVMMMYERLPEFETFNVGLQLQYYFPYFRAQGNLTSDEFKRSTYNVLASGSVSLDPRLMAMFFQNTPSYVGYGGMVVHPYVDANNNGQYDPGEEIVTKGRVYFADETRQAMPSSLPIDRFFANRLPSYEEYDIFLDPQTLDNPVWVPEFTSIRMLAEPNYVRRIDIPVVNGGSVHGTVVLNDGTEKPLEGITVKLLSAIAGENGKGFLRTTSTFSTGEFQFDLIPPGVYQVVVDPAQPQIQGYQVTPASKQVEIVSKAEGDFATGVDFVVKSK